MAGYTYADFENAAKQSGYYDRFSDYDRNLAREYPEVGLTLLQYKMDYDAADSDEGRKNANRRANILRGFYGGYSGGTDGSGYYGLGSGESAPALSLPDAPVYKGGAFEEKQSGVLKGLENEGFSYDKDSDPAWSAYAKEYRREGQRAAEDTLGKAAAATGGVPSSYAVTAAAQAENAYAGKLADKLPELAGEAYDRWQSDYERARKLADSYGKLADREYSRYRDERADYEADRKFDYAAWLDAFEASEKRRTEKEKALLEALK